MKLFRDLASLPPELRSGAVTIGNFDGVHRGHARIVERLVANARRVGGPALAFTFDPHPARLLRPQEAPAPLTWTERKAELLESLGVDALVAYPTDAALLGLEPREFFDQIVLKQLDAKALVEGPNFFFGKGRSGSIETLATFAGERGVTLEVVEPLSLDGDQVSSSRIRQLVHAGDVAAAARLLTAPYRIRGIVAHGAARGRSIGFPTANVAGIDTLLPALGVYAGLGHCRGKRFPAAINLGPNPTFGEQAVKVEVHLLDFHEAIYGEPLEVDFLQRLREIRTFSGIEELRRQLLQDIAVVREIVT